MDVDNALKVILLGETGVGKTNLINVTMGLAFNVELTPTILTSSNLKKYVHQNKTYVYNMWDTAGQEAYRAVNQIFIKDSKIVIIVFSIDNKNSFNEIEYWINNVKEILEEGKYIMGLVGNKIDLYEQQEVTEEELEEAAKKYNLKYTMTSALTQPSTFKKFLEKLLLDYITTNEIGDNKNQTTKLNNIKNEEKSKCKC